MPTSTVLGDIYHHILFLHKTSAKLPHHLSEKSCDLPLLAFQLKPDMADVL